MLGLALPGFKGLCRFETGCAWVQWGRYRQAESAFEQVLSAVGEEDISSRLQYRALYQLAQCREFQRHFERAKKCYRQLVNGPEAPDPLKKCAANALTRIASLSATPAGHSSAVYLGESRGAGGDFGDWQFNYGREVYILFAMMAPQDIVGGHATKAQPSGQVRPRPLNYRFTTATEGEPGRRWLTAADDRLAPGALWNPILFTHSSSNLDDFGEQMAPGEGDLIIDLDIPEGRWKLTAALTPIISRGRTV